MSFELGGGTSEFPCYLQHFPCGTGLQLMLLQLTVPALDIPGSRQTPRFKDLYCIRKVVWLHDSASVAAKTPHFKDLSDLRVSDLRTVNCNPLSALPVVLPSASPCRQALGLQFQIPQTSKSCDRYLLMRPICSWLPLEVIRIEMQDLKICLPPPPSPLGGRSSNYAIHL
jgi:hypothetical protein